MIFLKIYLRDNKEKQIGVPDHKDAQKVIDSINERQKAPKSIVMSNMFKVGSVWYTIEYNKVLSTEIVEL